MISPTPDSNNEKWAAICTLRRPPEESSLHSVEENVRKIVKTSKFIPYVLSGAAAKENMEICLFICLAYGPSAGAMP